MRKRDPIKMKGKEDLGMYSVRTVGAPTNVEIEIDQENLEEALQLSNDTGNKQSSYLKPEVSVTGTSVRQTKAPKSLSNNLLW
jgi:hypothetical protein